MRKASSLQGNWPNVVFSLIALLVVAADQLSKVWVSSYPKEQPIFEMGFFRLTHVHNTGAAFGLFQGHSFSLTIVAFVGIALLLLYALFIYRHFPSLDNMQNRVAVSLILGGTVGNLIDRLRFSYVTDFISIGIWPAFNIADSAITVGVIIFAYSLRTLARARKQ